jgi:hypothetical protein
MLEDALNFFALPVVFLLFLALVPARAVPVYNLPIDYIILCFLLCLFWAGY